MGEILMISEYLRVIHAGDHRGRLQSMRNWADQMQEFTIPICVTPIERIYTRRVQTITEAKKVGLGAEEGAGSLQEARLEGLLDEKPWVYIAFGKPNAIGDALDICAALNIGAVVNVFIEFPSWPLMAFRAVVAAGDHATRTLVRLLLSRLESMTTRTGSAAVFGPGSRPENMLIETLVRGRFFRGSARAIVKLSLGQDAEVVPVAITFDGVTDVPTVIVDASGGLRDPRTLAKDLIANPPFPILPGTEIVIIQIPSQNELVLHRARLRGIDHGMRVAAPRHIDVTGLADAIRNADRNVVSTVNPVRMTA
jgi:hypothetical protein